MSQFPTLYDILLQPGNRNVENRKDDGPFNIETFHRFLLKAHCEENLEFFQYCNTYICTKTRKEAISLDMANSKSETDLATTESHQHRLLKMWNNRIYLKYIALNSPRECNFPQEIREVFEKCYEEQQLPSDESVLIAMQHILQLLMDAYRQFIKFVNNSNDPLEELISEKSEAIITNFGEGDSTASTISKENEEDELKKTSALNWFDSNIPSTLESTTSHWGISSGHFPESNYLMAPKVNLSANDILLSSTTKLAPSVSPLISREISDIMNKNKSSVKRASTDQSLQTNTDPVSPKRRSLETDKRKSVSPILISPNNKSHSNKYSKSNGSSHVNRSIKASTSPLSHRVVLPNDRKIQRPISPPMTNLPHEHHSSTIVGKGKQLFNKLSMVGRKKNYSSHIPQQHSNQ